MIITNLADVHGSSKFKKEPALCSGQQRKGNPQNGDACGCRIHTRIAKKQGASDIGQNIPWDRLMYLPEKQ